MPDTVVVQAKLSSEVLHVCAGDIRIILVDESDSDFIGVLSSVFTGKTFTIIYPDRPPMEADVFWLYKFERL